jgi:hypothetical protein
MTNYLKKWPLIILTIIVALVAASYLIIRPKAHSPELGGVQEITLTPTDVAIPRVDLPWVTRPTNYLFQQDGAEYHLYFRNNDTLEKVIGDMPKFTDKPDLYFRGFTDVVSAAGITTYAYYEKYKTAALGSATLMASELYALKGNRVHKILSDIEPGGINSIDNHMIFLGAYLDRRDNLYVLTQNATLCVIRDGQVVGRADVGKVGAKRPALPSMFSDAENTYLLVPKLFNSENSMTGFGPVSEKSIEAKYKVNVLGQ